MYFLSIIQEITSSDSNGAHTGLQISSKSPKPSTYVGKQIYLFLCMSCILNVQISSFHFEEVFVVI